MGHNCGACKAEVRDGVNGRVWDDSVCITAYCEACLVKYDGGVVQDEEDGPCPNAQWYDTSSELD
jgi:hypothetical protein